MLNIELHILITNYAKFVNLLRIYSQVYKSLITDSEQVPWGKGEIELF